VRPPPGGRRIYTIVSHFASGADADAWLASPARARPGDGRGEKVFLLCSAAHDELAWHCNAIDAAARAGVGHLVRSSMVTAGGTAARTTDRSA
jgi:hypothetical protein